MQNFNESDTLNACLYVFMSLSGAEPRANQFGDANANFALLFGTFFHLLKFMNEEL
jgi:hypothetical protein